MASNRDSLGIAVPAWVLSSAALWLGTGLKPIACLTWIAAVPLLVASPRLGRRLAFGTAVAAHAIGDVNVWRYLSSAVPLPIHLLILLIPALAWGAAVVLFRSFVLGSRPMLAALALPVAWTAYESLWERASPHGTLFDLAYTQMDCAPLIQVAAVTGLLGIGFCLLLGSSAVSLLFISAPAGKKFAAIGMAMGVVGVALGYGFRRLHDAAPAPRVTVGLMACDVPLQVGAGSPEASLAIFRRYAGQIPLLASRGADVVVLPEHVGAFVDDALGGNARQVDALLGAAARRSRIYLAVGVDREVSAKKWWNQARLYAPDGRVAATYNKQHLLPGAEARFEAGTTRSVVSTAGGAWGLEICKDLDFPALSREYGRDRIGLLLVPAYDFRVDGWLHSRMAVLRGVESGFSLARAAAFGRLTLSDDRGRVFAEKNAEAAPFATLVASVPVRHDATPYDRWGEWFAWFNAALFVYLVAHAIYSGRLRPRCATTRP